jgi:hypothetical protein
METEINIKQLVSYSPFSSIRSAKKFSKIYGLLQIVNSQVDVEGNEAQIVTILQKEWAYNELYKMNLPEDFGGLGSFNECLRWYFRNFPQNK